MSKMLKAIRYRTIDDARKILAQMLPDYAEAFFLDKGEEPQGLLTVIPEDRLSEGDFLTLLDGDSGTLLEVERVDYSGYGPPAREEDYMGFISEKVAYILPGCRLPVEIHNCPEGARDLYHLEALLMDHQHSLDRAYLARKLSLPERWDFEHLLELILEGEMTAEEIDQLIHQGIQ